MVPPSEVPSFGGGEGASSSPRASTGGGPWDLGRPKWTNLKLTAAPVITGGKQITEEEHVRALFGLKRSDLRPVLVYFHHPHTQAKPDAAGRESAKQCPIMKEEMVERWAMLFRCYEVDVDQSDANVAERFGAGKGASYALLDAKLQVIARSEDFEDGKSAIAYLTTTLPAKFPDYWKTVQATVEEQRAAVEEARKLIKKDKLSEASARYEPLTVSTVRIADFYEVAFREAKALEKRLLQKDEEK